MEYKGMWNAATNTPTLANGTGDTGDVYICNVAGTVDFGAGPITFAVGDYTIYSGSIWQRSSGAVGTVTSVAASITGDAIGITGSPVTTSGTLALAFAGTSGEYINGAGNLTTFPTLTGYVPYTGATANVDLGTHTLLAAKGTFSNNGSSDTVGLTHSSGSGIALNITKGGNGEGLYINKTSGSGNAATIIGTLNATTLVKSGGTSAQFLKADGSVDSNTYLTASSLTGYVPYTGATANVNLGTNELLSRSVYIEGTASSQAGLLMKQISGFNFVTGAYTQVVPSGIYDLNVVHNQTNSTRRRYAISVAALQDNDSFQYLVPRKDGTFAMTSDIPSLSGYVQGTGTTNYLPKFTGTSTIGNSAVSDDGTTVTLNSRALSGTSASFSSSVIATGLFGYILKGRSSDNYGAFGFYSNNGATRYGYIQSHSTNGGQLNINADGGAQLIMDSRGSIFNVGNLGLGVTPSAWADGKAFEIGALGNAVWSGSGYIDLMRNVAYTSGAYRYSANGTASRFEIDSQSFAFYVAPSGTAGNAISFTQAMTLDASGRLGIGTTSPAYRLVVNSGTDGISAGISGSTYGIRFDNGGTFSSGMSTIHGVNSTLTGSYQPIMLNGLDVRFGTSATERMRLNASGNLSIGNTNDTYKLDVSGSARFTGVLSLNSNTNYILFGTDAAVNPYVQGGSDNSLFIGTGNATRLTIASTGSATFSSSVTATSGKFASANGTTYAATPQLRIDGNGVNNSYAQIVFTDSALSDGKISYFPAAAAENRYFSISPRQVESDFVIRGSNVGIGTTSPTAKLEIFDNANSGIIRLSRDNGNQRGAVEFGRNNGGSFQTCGSIIVDSDAASPNNGLMYFYTANSSGTNTERMRITSGGNVGIGTTSPARKLDVNGVTRSTAFDVYYNSVLSGFLLSENQWTGNSSTNLAIAAETGNAITFFTNGSATERLRITGGGQIINTFAGADNPYIFQNTGTNPYGPWFKFTTDSNNGTNYYWVASAVVSGIEYVRARILSNGGLANYQANNTNLSDIRTKKDITPLESYWDKFKAIEMVKFKYKDQTHDDFNIGVIAQQVEKVAPEFIDVDGWGETPKDGLPLKSVYTSDLHHATIKVLQEAMAKIEDLQNQLDTLKNK
jgi:hypothetical protein